VWCKKADPALIPSAHARLPASRPSAADPLAIDDTGGCEARGRAVKRLLSGLRRLALGRVGTLHHAFLAVKPPDDDARECFHVTKHLTPPGCSNPRAGPPGAVPRRGFLPQRASARHGVVSNDGGGAGRGGVLAARHGATRGGRGSGSGRGCGCGRYQVSPRVAGRFRRRRSLAANLRARGGAVQVESS
jgi:hypothetical protein